MQDMYGLAVLFELSQKDGRRKHEFDHLRETPPLRTRFFRFLRTLRLSKTPRARNDQALDKRSRSPAAYVSALGISPAW